VTKFAVMYQIHSDLTITNRLVNTEITLTRYLSKYQFSITLQRLTVIRFLRVLILSYPNPFIEYLTRPVHFGFPLKACRNNSFRTI